MRSLALFAIARMLLAAPIPTPYQSVSAGSNPVIVSVCDVFSNPGSYAGKVVAMRGRLRVFKEFFALDDPTCSSGFNGPHRNWPRAVHLVLHPKGPWRGYPGVDPGALQHADIIFTFFQECPPHELGVEVMLTATGRLETIWDRPSSSGNSGPRTEGPGFGHLANFAAQLVCQSVKDMVFRPVP